MTLNALGLFEMCNPHLLATETLSDAIKTRLCVPVFNSSRSSLVEMFVRHLSPKSQRIHRRDNRRGVLMMRRQKLPPSGSGKTPMESVSRAKPSIMSSSTNKRCSSDGTGESDGPSSKRKTGDVMRVGPGCVAAVSMLDLLPAQDILFPQVLARLAASDLFSLRAVSRGLHQLVSLYITVSRSLDLGYNKRVTEAAFQILTREAAGLRQLHLSGLKFLTDELLRPVLVLSPHLTSLELAECQHLTSGILQTLSSRSYQLERLILRDCHWVTRDSLEYHTFKQGEPRQQQSFTKLSELSSQCVRAGRPRTSGPDLQNAPRSNLLEVDLTGCWELNDTVLINFVSKFPFLRLVKLGNIYSITDDCMTGIARYCPHLTTLDITGCWRVTDLGVSTVGEYCRSLAELHVTDCRDVTEQSLTRLRQRGVRVDRQLDPVLLRLLRIRNEQRHARLQI